MKNNKYGNKEDFYKRLRELANVDKNLIKESKNTSTLIEHKEAKDGKVYGIFKENLNYFIKFSSDKENLNESKFEYIGGLSNITEYKCKSLTEAQKVLNTKILTINENYQEGDNDEVEQPQEEPVQNEQQPQEEPTPDPQPEPEQQPQPDSAPVDDETVNQVKSNIGKAGNLLSAVELPSEKSKQLIKMFLGYFNVEGMSDEDKNELSRLFKTVDDEQQEPVHEEVISEVDEFMMNPESIGAILAGVGAVFGGAYGIDKLVDYVKKKKPELGKKIEQIGKSASSGIRGGTTSLEENEEVISEVDEFMMNPESIGAILGGVGAVFGGAYGIDKLVDYVKKKKPELGKKIEQIGKSAGSGIRGGSTSLEECEDKIYESEEDFEDSIEDDVLDNMEGDPIDSPELDDQKHVDVSSGEKKVSIDLNSGKVDVNLSEEKIKNLSKKYNVSESYIKWKIKDLMKEEVEKTEKQKLKEEKLRKVVRNIIKEKLGLKKKTLNENVSKERLRLEKIVESVLKKNIKPEKK